MSLVVSQAKSQALVAADDATARHSSLASATLRIEGAHKDVISSLRYTSDGRVLASAGFDRRINLYRTSGDCENYAVLTGHKGAVLDLCFGVDGEQRPCMFTASSDKTAAAWDLESGARVRQFKGHMAIVNTVAAPPRRPLLVTGGNDGVAKLFDARVKQHTLQLDAMFQVTATAVTEDGNTIFTGGIDNEIKIWDTRRSEKPTQSLRVHQDTVTSLRLSPDGNSLLSVGMDSMACIFDVRPFCKGDRLRSKIGGFNVGQEQLLLKANWSPNGRRVLLGDASCQVFVFDVDTSGQGEAEGLLYRLPGHAGAVTEVVMHPTEPVLASASTDATIFLGELDQ